MAHKDTRKGPHKDTRKGPHKDTRKGPPRHEGTPAGITEDLIYEMGLDNGCTFTATPRQRNLLEGAAERMLAAGCKFTGDDIEELTAGEQTEVAERYGRYDGFILLNNTLGEIFNGE